MATETNKKKTKKRRPRRKFTEAFQADVVRLCQANGESISDVCKRLDLTDSAVRGWIKKAEEEGGESASANALTVSEKQELQRLRREVKQLTVEREILKKAAAFFAKEST